MAGRPGADTDVLVEPPSVDWSGAPGRNPLELSLGTGVGKDTSSLATGHAVTQRRYARRCVSARLSLELAGEEALMFDRIGILGILGFIIFVAWFVGWVFLGFHDGLYHLLFPISVVLMVAQGVKRVAR